MSESRSQSHPAPVAAEIAPLPPPLVHRTPVLVLQHPQEQRQALATVPLLLASLQRSRGRIGLSWPSLAAAWSAAPGEAAPPPPGQWLVLYLGARAETPPPSAPLLQLLDRKGEPLADAGALRGIGGLVLLDGTWAQVKALWWRNPWLLKLRRGVLNPRTPSLYGALRREPRAGALSTLEAAALALGEIEASPELAEALRQRLADFLARQPQPAALRRDFRRRRGNRSRERAPR